MASTSGAGTLPNTMPTFTGRPNAAIPIYEDLSDAAAASFEAAAPPPSILSAVKRQEAPKENTIKPGTWSAAKLKKVHASGVPRTPSFTSNSIQIMQFCLL